MIQKEKPKQETLEEDAVIDLTNLCHYDKRNPDCSVDDEGIEDHKNNLFKKNKTCSCDNCFYGRTELTEQLILQAERMYSKEDVDRLISIIEWYDNESDVREDDEFMWFENFKKK